MILELGTASSGELTELFAELSALNRRLGGPGVKFRVNECRTWRLSEPKAGASSTGSPKPEADKMASADRSFVEIYAVPKTPAEADAKFSASHWDRFTASLFMVLRLDAGQANYFDLAETASCEHPSHILATDAALRATEKTVRSSDGKSQAAAGVSVDALNQHLQKIEELRRKLEREESLVLELAPAVEIPPEEAPVEPPAAVPHWQPRRRNVAIAAAAAAAALLIAGLFYVLRPSPARTADPAPAEARSTSSN